MKLGRTLNASTPDEHISSSRCILNPTAESTRNFIAGSVSQRLDLVVASFGGRALDGGFRFITGLG